MSETKRIWAARRQSSLPSDYQRSQTLLRNTYHSTTPATEESAEPRPTTLTNDEKESQATFTSFILEQLASGYLDSAEPEDAWRPKKEKGGRKNLRIYIQQIQIINHTYTTSCKENRKILKMKNKNRKFRPSFNRRLVGDSVQIRQLKRKMS